MWLTLSHLHDDRQAALHHITEGVRGHCSDATDTQGALLSETRLHCHLLHLSITVIWERPLLSTAAHQRIHEEYEEVLRTGGEALIRLHLTLRDGAGSPRVTEEHGRQRVPSDPGGGAGITVGFHRLAGFQLVHAAGPVPEVAQKGFHVPLLGVG